MIRKILVLTSLLFLAACANRSREYGTPLVPIPSAPARHAEPSGFVGLAPDALRTRLGAPAFSRKDGTTEMWRYDTNSCHAFFFLTAGLVAHVETIPRSNDAADLACLNALKKP